MAFVASDKLFVALQERRSSGAGLSCQTLRSDANTVHCVPAAVAFLRVVIGIEKLRDLPPSPSLLPKLQRLVKVNLGVHQIAAGAFSLRQDRCRGGGISGLIWLAG
jgi:hypothetical protein